MNYVQGKTEEVSTSNKGKMWKLCCLKYSSFFTLDSFKKSGKHIWDQLCKWWGSSSALPVTSNKNTEVD